MAILGPDSVRRGRLPQSTLMVPYLLIRNKHHILHFAQVSKLYLAEHIHYHHIRHRLVFANGIVLPYKGTSALVSLPFFHIGYLIRKSGFLTENKHRDKYLFASIIPISVFVYYIAQPVNIAGLHLPDHYWIFYTAGIGGTLSILFLSKWIKHLPGIAYFGRYSLITFGTHWSIFTTAGALLYPLISESFTSYLLILLIVLACEMVLIPIGIKYFPRFTAQQELIPSDLLNKEKIKKQ